MSPAGSRAATSASSLVRLLPFLIALPLSLGFGPHDALRSGGTQATRIEHLWWMFFWICTVVYVISFAAVLYASFKRRRPGDGGSDPAPRPDLPPEPARDRRASTVVSAAVGLTIVILFTLALSDYVTGRRIHALSDESGEKPLNVRITGHQWWWEVQYNDPTPSNILLTSNEIHLPVGRVVDVELNSNDVIHSFWVPELHGKKDMIPLHPTRIRIRADKPGTYYGQCAEFCGFQHAKMRLVVVAEPKEQFEAWHAAQMQQAPEPTTDSQKRGKQVFETGTCSMCHTIQGTLARSRLGPELTHIGSRSRIAGNWLPNTRGNLGGWIADAQKIKPGVRMPPNPLPPADLQALLDYLESLK
jgi:cytochrome c oxidase subunit 2